MVWLANHFTYENESVNSVEEALGISITDDERLRGPICDLLGGLQLQSLCVMKTYEYFLFLYKMIPVLFLFFMNNVYEFINIL